MPPLFRKTPSTVRRLDPAKIAAALGAEPAGVRLPTGGPAAVRALHAGAYIRSQSKGGRHIELTISDDDWARLEALATELSGPGSSPSAGQVASILLSLALDSVKPAAGAGDKRPDPALAEKLAEKVASQT